MVREDGVNRSEATGDTAAVRDRADAFAAELAGLGIQCAVTIREGVALVTPLDEQSANRFANQELRQTVLAVGRTIGVARVGLLLGGG